MSIQSAETIDVHAHAVLEETMGAAGEHGPTLTKDEPPVFTVGSYQLHGVRYRGSAFMEPELRLTAMDKAGIDFQVLSPNPLTYFHFIDAKPGQQFCRIHNDALAEVVRQHPDRLAAFAAVPMQNIQMAIEETQRAVTELGCLGPYIGTDFGRPLNDPAMDAYYAALVELDVPLFIHPAPAGIDGPAGDANLQQFDLDIIIGFAAQETIAVGTLIYGGVLDDIPISTCASAMAAELRGMPMVVWLWPQGNAPGPATICARMARLTSCYTDSGLMCTYIRQIRLNCCASTSTLTVWFTAPISLGGTNRTTMFARKQRPTPPPLAACYAAKPCSRCHRANARMPLARNTSATGATTSETSVSATCTLSGSPSTKSVVPATRVGPKPRPSTLVPTT